MPDIITYALVQHTRSQEIWALRTEGDVLTGVCGPFSGTPPSDLTELAYEDHPDDLEWVIRAVEHFRVLR